MKFTVSQLYERYPDDDACLAELFAEQDPTCKCGRKAWSKIAGRPAYACSCGRQFSPLVGTIFAHSSTPLRTWFYVVYVMSTSKSGVSAKQIERETGVTYKTAWRMMKLIREQMRDETPLSGEVEADEAFFKPKAYKNSRVPQIRGNSEILLGLTERGGRVIVKHIPTTGARGMQRNLQAFLEPGSHLFTDGAIHYFNAPKWGYTHTAFNHYKSEPFEPGKLHFKPISGASTQYIEGFWNQLKRGIYGVYRHCDPKYLESYANEYAWRYSNRHSDVPMFELLLKKVVG